MFLANLIVFCPANATLNATDRQEFAVNNILFYDPNGCTSAFTTSGKSDGSDVYIIGDSITVNSQTKIKEKLPKATINALSGTYFSHDSEFGLGGTNRIKDMGSQDILVFAMGSNGGINQMYPDDTDKLFQALAGKNVQVILMTIYYNGYSTEQMNNSNQVVRDLAKNYSNITYFDWNAAVAGNPSQYIVKDGVHPTDAGAEKFADVLTTAVNKVTKMVGSGATGTVSGSGYDRLKSAVREYGEFAMSMQIEYGTPWEVVLAQMQIESGVGTAGIAVSGATNNWLGITGSGDAGSWSSNGGRKWAVFSSVEASIQAWAGTTVLRNGYYDDAFPYLDPSNWDLEAFLVKMISHYAPDSDGNNEAAYVQNIISLVNGPIREEREAQGWPSSEEFAKQNNIPVGGKYPINSQISGDSIASSSYSSSYCEDESSAYGNGVTTATINGLTYAFPLAYATKENYLQPGSRGGKLYSVLSPLPCKSYTPGSCHHKYVALDMGINLSMVPGAKTYGSSDFSGSGANFGDIYYYSTGTEVVALVDGTITSYKTYSNGVPSDYVDQCASVSYKGEDGKLYWFGHMSYESEYAAGQSFKAGDVIGHVGPPPCAQNTQAHFHIHIQPDTANDTYLYDVMNTLYEALPADAAELAAREAGASLTETQAQRLAAYYKSNAVTKEAWGLPSSKGKWNCVSFSAWFIQAFTTVGHYSPTSGWGNGKDTAHYIAMNKNLQEGNTPKPYSVFSVTKGSMMCGNVACGHTGIVVAVNGDDITTIEAAFGAEGYTEVVHRDISYFTNAQYGYTFTYLSPIMVRSNLQAIVGS